jgi:hypothetical protein
MTGNDLRPLFASMNPKHASEIRAAYYNAMAGLRDLATALEVADSECNTPEIDLLLSEHLLAAEALAVMNKSQLGEVL